MERGAPKGPKMGTGAGRDAMMAAMNRHLLLLAVCQGLFLTNNVTFIAINGLVGLSLAPLGWMATLPVTGYVVGAALSAMPVARLQARVGRKRAFQVGLVVAALSSALCALAVALGSFWLLVAATPVAGFYSANAALSKGWLHCCMAIGVAAISRFITP